MRALPRKTKRPMRRYKNFFFNQIIIKIVKPVFIPGVGGRIRNVHILLVDKLVKCYSCFETKFVIT